MSRFVFENKSAKAATYSEKIESSSTMTNKTAQKFGQLKLQMYLRYEYKSSKVEHGECMNANCRYNYDDDDDAYDTLAPIASDFVQAAHEVSRNNGYCSVRREVNELKSEDYDCASSYHEKQQNFLVASSDDGHGYVSEDQGTFENGYEGDCDEEIDRDRNCDNNDACDHGNLVNNNISAIYADANCGGDDEYYHGYYYDDDVEGMNYID